MDPAAFAGADLPPIPTVAEAAENLTGRPTLLTRETVDALKQGVASGLRYKQACELAGVSYPMFRQWVTEGLEEWERGELSTKVTLVHEITQVLAKAEKRLLDQWSAHMKDDYRAVRDFMAVRWPERYSPKQIHEHTGQVTTGVVLLPPLSSGEDTAMAGGRVVDVEAEILEDE